MDVHQVRADLLGALRGEQAEGLLRQALESSGLTLHSWTLEQLYTRPDAEISAVYRVQCTPDAAARPEHPGPAARPPRATDLMALSMVASTVALTSQQRRTMGAVRADSSRGTVHLWVHPVDPELPGLRVVESADPLGGDHPGDTELETRLSRLLAEPCRLRNLQRLVLRPLRRAVYRAVVSSAQGQRVLYLKVVRPARAAQLLQRHRCSSLIPGIGDAGDGVLVIAEAPGVPLTRHLYRSTAPTDVGQLEPSVLLEALQSLRAETLSMPRRTAPAQRLGGLAESAIAAGSDPVRVQRLSDRIGAALCEAPGPIVPTHGDFHPANLFLDETAQHPTALIDADTVGPGFRADDLATMLGHLLVLPSYDGEGYAAVPEFARRFHTRCLIEAEATDLGARTAAVLLSLLPGAHSPEQAEHHLRCAEKLAASPAPQEPRGGFAG